MILESEAQNGFLTKKVNFDNFAFEYPSRRAIESPGKILINAYLNGALPGYAFAFQDTVIEYSQPAVVTRVWNAEEEYYYADTVIFKDRFYRPYIDIAPSGVDPVTGYWHEITELRTPLQIAYRLPSSADTLSKAAFLEAMLVQELETFSAWESSTQYQAGDMVTYNGQNFTANTDPEVNSAPDQSDDWYWTGDGQPTFYLPSDVSDVTLLMAYRLDKQDTVWYPQMITLSIRGEITASGLNKPIIHFLYDDVIRYLRNIPLPVFNSPVHGHLGNGLFELNFSVKEDLLQWVKESIKSNKLKVKKSSVADMAQYQRWLLDSLDNRYGNNYSVSQKLNSKSLLISKAVQAPDGMPIYKPFLRLSGDQVASILKPTTVNFYTYYDALVNPDFLCCSNVLDYPMLESRGTKQLEKGRKTGGRFMFLDKYAARIDSSRNPALAKVMPELIALLMNSIESRKINPKTEPIEFYRSTFDWTSLNPWKTNNHTVDLPQYLFEFDNAFSDSIAIDPIKDVQAIEVLYKKTLTSDADSFTAERLTLRYFSKQFDDGLPRSLAFNWKDILKLAEEKRSPSLTKLITMIEKGDVDYMDNEVMYGVTEAQ